MPVHRLKGPEAMFGYTAFNEQVAVNYESWYETPEGRRADELEKALWTRCYWAFLTRTVFWRSGEARLTSLAG